MSVRFDTAMLQPVLESVTPALERMQRAERDLRPWVEFLLRPLAVTAYTLAFWRLAADMNWLGEFFISSGLLSRWQVWLAMAIAIHMAAAYLAQQDREERS